jgi:hypothetical protein
MKRNPAGFWTPALLALAWATPPALAQTPETLPAAVAEGLREFTDMCRDVGGNPDTGEAITRVDLNGDGHADYVLDVGGIQCQGAWSIFGDRMKPVTVYAGDGNGGARLAFSSQAFGSTVEGSGSEARLWLSVYSELCGKRPASSFAEETFCDRPLVWNEAKREFEFAPVETVRMMR